MAAGKSTPTKSAPAKVANRNKTAKKDAFVRAREAQRLMATGGGDYTYVFTDAGTTLQVRVGSDKFTAAVNELLQGDAAAKVRQELTELAAQFPGKGFEGFGNEG